MLEIHIYEYYRSSSVEENQPLYHLTIQNLILRVKRYVIIYV